MLTFKIKILLISTLISQLALSAQTFDFKYSFEGERLSISQEAPDYNSALTEAAKSCFSHFKAKTQSNQQKGIDLIDVCANPRS